MTENVISKYSPQETRRLIDKCLEETVMRTVSRPFGKYPQLKSATLFVSQFWNDEADDAVHEHLVYSIHDNPDMESWTELMTKQDPDNSLDYGLYACLFEGWDALYATDMEVTEWGTPAIAGYCDISSLDNNHEAVSLFAAYCEEGGSQDNEFPKGYQPIAILRRDESIEFYGELLRPWLLGVKPEWEQA